MVVAYIYRTVTSEFSKHLGLLVNRSSRSRMNHRLAQGVLELRPRIRQKEGGRFQRSCAYFTNMFPILVLHILSIFFGVPFKGQ